MQSYNEATSSRSTSSASIGNDSTSSQPPAPFKKPPGNIVITSDTLNQQKLARKQLEQTKKVNKSDQQRINCDVDLSGFEVKPNANAVVQNLMKLFDQPASAVKSHYHFEHRAASKSYHHVVITFKEMSD